MLTYSVATDGDDTRFVKRHPELPPSWRTTRILGLMMLVADLLRRERYREWRSRTDCVSSGHLDEAALLVGAEPVAAAADGQHVVVVQEPVEVTLPPSFIQS